MTDADLPSQVAQGELRDATLANAPLCRFQESTTQPAVMVTALLGLFIHAAMVGHW